MPRQFLLILTLVVGIRLAFLNQAIQGDDVNYLTAAEHAQIDPLHPTEVRYVFHGDLVDMRGHPHPPLNAWILAGLLAGLRDIKEIPYHAAYAVFSLMAAGAAFMLARRFSSQPLLATLLFVATPAFVINGNSLEADIPFLAFWMTAVALFVSAVDRKSARFLTFTALALVPAALAAYQSVLLVPVLGLYLWVKERSWRPAWLVIGVAPLTLVIWQLWERISSGALPATVLAGYFQAYGFQSLMAKLRNAGALTVHTGWLVFPLLAVFAFRKPVRLLWLSLTAAVAGFFIDANPLFWASFFIGVLVIVWCLHSLKTTPEVDARFLAGWVLIFFAGALVFFFAGSARYLLPMVAPVAMLTTRNLSSSPRWLLAGGLVQLVISLSLAIVNYQHWDGYRDFAASLAQDVENRRVWINGEWGLRYYLEARGGLPLMRNQPVRPGDMVVWSDLAYPIPFSTGGGALVPVAEREIRSSLPLCLVGLKARSGYSTASLGLRPFDICRDTLDRVHAALVVERKPVLSYLPMNAPEAGQQIVSGVYELENKQWRWMADRAVILLKAPEKPAPLELVLYIPDHAPARHVSVWVDDRLVATRNFSSTGPHTITTTPVLSTPDASVRVTIWVDRTFSVAGDQRSLGIVLNAVGFK